MSKSNRKRVEEALATIVEGFKPFVADRLKGKYGDDWIEQSANNAGQKFERHAGHINEDDADFILKVTISHWHNVFSKVLGNAERSYVGELREARHKWAHQEPFTLDEVARVLDTGHLLLAAVSSDKAGQLDEERQTVQRLRFEEQTKKDTKAPIPGLADTGPVEGLKAWRDVVAPHDDVASGRYQQAEFAADLAQVRRGNAISEYSDPQEFFRRTYVTRGLGDLLAQTMRRVTGNGGEPIIDLLTNFGGGKTHSLLAVYHLCAPDVDALNLPNIDQIAIAEDIHTFPQRINRAVLVGTAMSPNRIDEKDDGVSVRTMWGELAWQLGGADAYEMVRPEDEGRVDPGSDILTTLLNTYSPTVILIDEWVAYARQLWDRDDLQAGSFDVQMSFAQSLTEAVRAVPTAMLLVSIPASDRFDGDDSAGDAGIEVGGVGGVEALKRLRNVIKRAETPWQPADAEESFEIVRRRLFKPLESTGFADRDATARRFHTLYVDNAAEFPSEARQPAYEDRIKRAYPFHPELFDRLYQDWASLERFQRTRGVLRLMAAVVHALWISDDQRPLIMPGSIPLGNRAVREEFTNHLEANWASVIDADIDGASSTAATLDRDVQNLGRSHATKRVARTIFLGSAPAERQGAGPGRVRGVEDVRIRLGVVQPGESPAMFGDALRRMSDRAAYLFQLQSRYWFGTEPSIQRKAQDQADAYAQDIVWQRLIEVIRNEGDLGAFKRVHRVPTSSSDIPDEDRAGLVILGPEHTHRRSRSKTRDESPAQITARHITEKRGTIDRHYRNMLLFLVPDEDQLAHLEQAIRQELAWQSILDQRDDLDLSQGNVRQAQQRLDQAAETVRQRLTETYCWLINPTATKGEPTTFDAIKSNGSGSLAQRATTKAQSNRFLVDTIGPANLRDQLDTVPLWKPDTDHIEVTQIWDYFASIVYLPRLSSSAALLDAVANGTSSMNIAQDGFGYAETCDANGYRGLIVHQHVPSPQMTGLLVKPEVALAHAKRAKPDDPVPGDSTEPTDSTSTPPATPTSLIARKELDPVRLGKEVHAIAQEVINTLVAAEGANPTVTLGLEANLSNVDKDTLATIIENLRALGFSTIDIE